MISVLSTMSPNIFIETKNEDMTLLHHAAFDGNLEAMQMMTSLPYFKDIIDDNSNEV